MSENNTLFGVPSSIYSSPKGASLAILRSPTLGNEASIVAKIADEVLGTEKRWQESVSNKERLANLIRGLSGQQWQRVLLISS